MHIKLYITCNYINLYCWHSTEKCISAFFPIWFHSKWNEFHSAADMLAFSGRFRFQNFNNAKMTLKMVLNAGYVFGIPIIEYFLGRPEHSRHFLMILNQYSP